MRKASEIMRVLPILLCFVSSLGAQDSEATPDPGRSGGAAVAVRLSEPVRIDGVLDDAAWEQAVPVSGFVQAEPVEGAEVEHRTEVRVLFDDEALYVGARMYDDSPQDIARQLVRRDEWGQYDHFEVSLDPDRDRRTGYRFRVSAAGVQIDEYLFDDVQEDRSWDAVWQSDVQVDAQGWTAELRIPLSQIRFQPSDDPQAWGINFGRRRLASNEVSFFALESRRQHGRVSVFRSLTGLVLPRGVRRLEARPYVLARTNSGPTEPGNPFFDGRDQSAGAGLDLRYGIGPTFTLDATLNPDFGQVEVDPAVINLSAFETIYPERRPFFVEDARIFDFNLSGGSLFYSRRIGREPHRTELDDARFVNASEETSILGAAKLTGRTNRGLSVGLLTAVTGREEAEAYFAGDDSIAVFLAEPRTEFGVARLRQELRGGRTLVGGIATLLHRELPDDGTFDFLPSSSLTTGLDFEHQWSDRAWALWGFLAGSHVRGSEEALIRLQRSSNHYFQRPDAYRLDVDSSATSMTGMEWRLQLDRRSGRNWTGSVWAAQRSAGFDANELGQFRGGERLDGGARINYREITPGSVFRDYRIGFFTFHNFRHEVLRDPFSWSQWGHGHKRGSFGLSFDGTLLNYWGIDLNTRFDPENLDDEITRGGPLMVDPRTLSAELRVNTDRRKKLGFEPSLGVDNDGGLGWGWRGSMEVRYRPSSRVEIETEPTYRFQPDAAQYVGTTGDVGFAPTYGRRYLFADLKHRTFSLDTRLNVTFSRGLTLQLFAQPLLSVGDYTAYKQLARAESFDFDRFEEGTAVSGTAGFSCVGGRTCVQGETRFVDFDRDGRVDYSFDEQDFRVRSLRGNAVLRWEYRPGSTLYLVWQQRRAYEDLDADTFDLRGETLDLFRDRPENVFIVKANYWLSL
jgi:hypothetical protein